MPFETQIKAAPVPLISAHMIRKVVIKVFDVTKLVLSGLSYLIAGKICATTKQK